MSARKIWVVQAYTPTKSGVTHFTKDRRRRSCTYPQATELHPQNNLEEAPYTDCTDPIDRLEDSLNDIIPDNPEQALRYVRSYRCYR